ncbi:glucuronyl esterase domain-containing protein [Aegicerativicinus sediminis]|uniref:glucuronyl esterase domain-containing protein n=1 Tax=Aegicerativicinus sediminis TaxID=2893202 RepID=UPI001E46A758|nr:acetylxylan esterase [Aegicerativicinus sediminis]
MGVIKDFKTESIVVNIVTLLAFTFLSFSQSNLSDPLCLDASRDKEQMKQLLGITELRPGKNGNAEAKENPANYEIALATPFTELPELMETKNGRMVQTIEDWEKVRRPEIVDDFEKEVYGEIPKNVPDVTWEVVFEERELIGWTPVTVKKLIGKVDNRSYPIIDVNIAMVVVTPANVKGKVPLLMMYGPAEVPAPNQPRKNEFEYLNQVLLNELRKDPKAAKILDEYPAYSPLMRPSNYNNFGFYRFSENELVRERDLINAGWGYAKLDTNSIQPDNGESLTCTGVIALTNKGKTRTPKQWGALRAWAWGASRGLDYLETDPRVDATKVGIEGVSRYGKAALVTMAFDQRFAVGLIGSSGKGGTTLHRRNFGEAVENLTGGFYYWMAGNYLKYGAEKGKLGKLDASNLPVDSHQLIALCAPRPVFISYGIPEQGDAHWLDHQGSYMAAVAAQPIYRLYGKKALGVSDDYMNEQMPDVKVGLLDGALAWRQHDGGHTDTPNIKYFVEWADNQLKVKN